MLRSQEILARTQSRTQLLSDNESFDPEAKTHHSRTSSIKAISGIDEIDKPEQLRDERLKVTNALMQKIEKEFPIMIKSMEVYDKIKTSSLSGKSLQEHLNTKSEELDELREIWHQFIDSATALESLIQNLRVIQDRLSTRLRANKPFEWENILGELKLEEIKETHPFNYATFKDEKESPVVFQVAKKPFAEGGFGSIFKARKITENSIIQPENYVCKFIEEKDFYLKESALINIFGMSNLPPTRVTINEGGRSKHFVAVFMKDLGEPLSSELETIRSLDGLEKIELLKKLAHRVCLLHEMHIIHCDIKLNNFLISLSADKKRVLDAFLIDFGGVKYTSSKNSLISSALYVLNHGTPESVIEEKRELSSDVFALGIAFIDMLKKPESVSALKEKRDYRKKMDDDLAKQNFEEKIMPFKNSFKEMVKKLDSKNLDKSAKQLQEIMKGLTMNSEWSHFIDRRKIEALKTLYDTLCKNIEEENELSAIQTQQLIVHVLDSSLITTFYHQKKAEITIPLNFDGLCESDPVLMQVKPVISQFLSRMTFNDHAQRPSSEEVRDFFDILAIYYKSTETETKDIAKLKLGLMAANCWNLKIGKKPVFDNETILKLFNNFDKYQETIKSFYEKLKLIDLTKISDWGDASHVRFLMSIEKDFSKVLKAFLFLRNEIAQAKPGSKQMDQLLKDWKFSNENNKVRLDAFIQLEKTGQLNPGRVLKLYHKTELDIDTSKKVESKGDGPDALDEKTIYARTKSLPLKKGSTKEIYQTVLKHLHKADSDSSSTPKTATALKTPPTRNRLLNKVSSRLSSLWKSKNTPTKDETSFFKESPGISPDM